MKIRLLIFAAITILLASCTRPEIVDKTMFSVECPAGYTVSGDELNMGDFREAVGLTNKTSSIAVIAFPSMPDTKKFLYTQTFSGLNEALRNCTFGVMRPVNIGGADGFSVPAIGTIAGQSVKGAIYALPKGDYMFLIMAFSPDGVPDSTEKIISSITPKQDMRPEEERNAELLENVINFSRKMLPRQIDEVTRWTEVDVDNDRKCLVITMTISGNSDDYDLDYLRNFIETDQRDSALTSFRENRSSDYLIEIPARLGYGFEYVYITATDSVPLGSFLISNDDLNP